MAHGFAAAGAHVVVTGRDAEKNERVAGELGELGMVLAADVRDEEAMVGVVAATVERYGSLDILVNNAGLGGRASFLDMTEESWRTMIDTHLTGSFLTSKAAVQAMISGGGGSIINMGSMYSIFGPPRGVHYATAKSGMLGLTRALAVELAPYAIRVNAILPGWIDTEMTSLVRTTKMGEEIVAKIPLGRFGVPDDLVGAALLLASDAGRYITGSEIAVDGGYRVADRAMVPAGAP
jgi:2-deoxy-D-gluconate 3-dehydrogenase